MLFYCFCYCFYFVVLVIVFITILCSKNGNVEALNGTYDAKAKTITFEAEDYADYALVYQETDKPDNGGGNDQEPETDDNTKKDDNKQNGNKDNNKNNNNKNNNKNKQTKTPYFS